MPGLVGTALDALINSGSPKGPRTAWLHDEYYELKYASGDSGLTLRTGDKVSGSAFSESAVTLLNRVLPRQSTSPTSTVRATQSGSGDGLTAQISPVPHRDVVSLSSPAMELKFDQDVEIVEGLNTALGVTEREPDFSSLKNGLKTFFPVQVAVSRPPPDNVRLSQVPPDGISEFDFGVLHRAVGNSSERVPTSATVETAGYSNSSMRYNYIREMPLQVTGMVGSHERSKPYYQLTRHTGNSYNSHIKSKIRTNMDKQSVRVPLQTGQRPNKLKKLNVAPKVQVDKDPQNLVLCGKPTRNR